MLLAMITLSSFGHRKKLAALEVCSSVSRFLRRSISLWRRRSSFFVAGEVDVVEEALPPVLQIAFVPANPLLSPQGEAAVT